MARKPRIEYPGAIYHVMVRGNNREDVFAQDVDKAKYLEILAKYKRKYNYRLYAYSLLNNHGHLLMETAETPLSKVMQGIQQVYTQYYNDNYNRVGHAFQQRYKAKICDGQQYFLELIRYIHKNPMEAGLSYSLDYPWSSHMIFMQPHRESIVDTEFPLSLFNPNMKKALTEYSFFVGVDKPFPAKEFPDYAGLDKDTISRLRRQNLDGMLAEILEGSSISRIDIMSKKRDRRIVAARKQFITGALQLCNCHPANIAEYLGISKAAVSKVLKTLEA